MRAQRWVSPTGGIAASSIHGRGGGMAGNLSALSRDREGGGDPAQHERCAPGRYDMVAICEAPDEGSVARALLSVTSKGSITSETCRAFTEQEYRQIIGGLT